MVSREDVNTAYELLLDRAPENDQVRVEKMANAEDPVALIMDIAGSQEFLSLHRAILMRLFAD